MRFCVCSEVTARVYKIKIARDSLYQMDKGKSRSGPALPVPPCDLASAELRDRSARGWVDPPQTAGEYLMRVRLEAESIPNVICANVDGEVTNRRSSEFEENGGGSDATLDEPWFDDAVADFSDTRQYIFRWGARGVPNVSMAKGPKLPSRSDRNGWSKFCKAQRPLAATLVGLDEATRSTALLHLVRLLSAKRVAFESNIAAWIYALLASLDLPLMPDDAACLRQLREFCAASCPSLSDDLAPACRVLLCIVERYFGQGDRA